MSSEIKMPGIIDPSLIRLQQLGNKTKLKDLHDRGEVLPEHSKQREQKEMLKAAQGFEAMMLQEMFKSMWNSMPKNGLLTGQGNEEEYYRDMLNESIADTVSKVKSIGIKDVILREMEKKQG